MAVRSVNYVPLATAADTQRFSRDIWSSCPVEDIIQDPQLGTYFFDDFLVAGNLSPLNAISSMGQWAAWGDTGATLGTDPQQDGGVVLLSPGNSTTANITLGSTAGNFRIVSAATNFPLQPGKLWFEARVAVGSITTAKRDCFVGLVDNTGGFSTASGTAVIGASNVLATAPALFGFHFRATTNPTDVGLAFNVAGGTVQYPTNLQTLSNTVAGAALTAYTAGSTGNLATGFIRLGFIYDPMPPMAQITSATSGQTANNYARPLITVFVNGIKAGAFLSSTNLQAATFPATWMAPVVSVSSRSATNPLGFYADYVRVFQLANS